MNPNNFWKLDPDPYPSGKLDPDPHKNEKVEALELVSFLAHWRVLAWESEW